MRAWRAGLWARVGTAAVTAIVVTAIVLVIAFMAVGRTRYAGRELSQRLVPAASTLLTLQKNYNIQQVVLRNYLTTGQKAQFAPYVPATRSLPALQARLARLISGYPHMPAQFAAVLAAHRAWSADVAAPQLAAIARGNLALARGLQDNIPKTRPYVLTLRDRVQALQTQITTEQGSVTGRLVHEQDVLIGALAAMCVLVLAIAIGGLLAVRRWLLKPFNALRKTAENVADGNYDDPLPVGGPSEFADLARSTDRMRKQLVVSLAKSERAEEGFRRLFDAAPDATLAVRADGTIALGNARAETLFGYPRGQLKGQQVDRLLPDAAATIVAAHPGMTAQGASGQADRPNGQADPASGQGDQDGGGQVAPAKVGLEFPGVRRAGSQFPAEISLNGLTLNNHPVLIVTIRDLTDRKAMAAERERLTAQAERNRLERRLQQSQRLESLGQLAGGVAHDFNNLLGVITGYTGIIKEELAEHVPQGDQRLILAHLGQVQHAAERAAGLTRQLLAFARQEVIKPRALDLNHLVTGVQQLLTRTLGEHVELVTELAPSLHPVMADPGQMEQVLVNLAVNARDAMPGGGYLTISTANLVVDESTAPDPGIAPGEYAVLKVSDSGTGMPREILDRVFDPFFTTKGEGQGTGLGLATVYGIITQTHGFLKVYSEPGLGTTFTVLLPRTNLPAHETGDSRHGTPPRGSGETVLLVEDEAAMREATRHILTRNGYRVLSAANGPQALSTLTGNDMDVDIVLTDVVMPHMPGKQLVDRIRDTYPSIRVLFMSGYTQGLLSAQGVLEPGIHLIEKPFDQATLLIKLSDLLKTPV